MHKDSTAYFLLVAIGLLIFFTISFTFSFRDKVFQAFFQKPFSFAQETDETPKIDLIAGIDNSFKRGMVNIENGKSNIALKWKTENAPTSCTGRFWSSTQKTESAWVGPKNTNGGEYVIKDSLSAGVYIYSIDCANEAGDASGSSITINVGAKSTYLQPHVASFEALGNSARFDLSKLNAAHINTKLTINWTTINMDGPYAVCVANGSWPTIYKNTGNLQINESFELKQSKIYRYSVFCSNENGYDRQEISFVAR